MTCLCIGAILEQPINYMLVRSGKVRLSFTHKPLVKPTVNTNVKPENIAFAVDPWQLSFYMKIDSSTSTDSY